MRPHVTYFNPPLPAVLALLKNVNNINVKCWLFPTKYHILWIISNKYEAKKTNIIPKIPENTGTSR